MATSVEIFLTSVFMTHLVLLIFVRENVPYFIRPARPS
jgi:hypothetical protein